MKIYLIRHGETDWNHINRFQGREDIELNAAGIAQAVRCGQTLQGLGIEAVYTSPLKRAHCTDVYKRQLRMSSSFVERTPASFALAKSTSSDASEPSFVFISQKAASGRPEVSFTCKMSVRRTDRVL